jgi:galactose mutarotase-like enzyme
MSSPEHVELTASGLSAVVARHGAQLMSLKTAEGQELLWQGDPRYWADRAPILFPVIGPMVGGQIHHGGHSYPMPPHGFAHGRDFAVSQQTPTSCVLELRDDEETRAHYPFAFTLSVGFELSDDGLLGTITVENPNDEPLPADVGFHPGFNWPLSPGRPKEDYAIVFAESEPAPIRRGVEDPILLLPEGRPTPVEENVLRLRDELFEENAIVFDRPNSRSVTYGAPGAPGLRVDFPDSPNLAIWSRPGAPYVCIEPWQGYPSQIDFDGPFVEKPGIALIDPGTSRRWRLGITPQPDGELYDEARRHGGFEHAAD